MKIELVQYPHEENPHGFEASVSVSDLEHAEDTKVGGRVHVGRVKIFNEETGKFTWFVIEAKRNGNKAPVLEITNIRPEQDKITQCVGRYRTPEPEDLVRANNEAL